MLVLALDTTTRAGSLALARDEAARGVRRGTRPHPRRRACRATSSTCLASPRPGARRRRPLRRRGRARARSPACGSASPPSRGSPSPTAARSSGCRRSTRSRWSAPRCASRAAGRTRGRLDGRPAGRGVRWLVPSQGTANPESWPAPRWHARWMCSRLGGTHRGPARRLAWATARWRIALPSRRPHAAVRGRSRPGCRCWPPRSPRSPAAGRTKGARSHPTRSPALRPAARRRTGAGRAAPRRDRWGHGRTARAAPVERATWPPEAQPAWANEVLPPGWRVDTLAKADLDEVLAIERASFSNPWTREMFLWELQNAGVSYGYVLREPAGAVAGFCTVWLVLDELHINNVAVRPECPRPGGGAGAAALRAALRRPGSARGGRRSRCGGRTPPPSSSTNGWGSRSPACGGTTIRTRSRTP